MLIVEIIRHPSDAERRKLIEFVEQLSGELGVRPLSDHLWLDLNKRDPAGDGDGFIAVTVADAEGILGMAQISAANDSSSLELVVRPRAVGSQATARRSVRDRPRCVSPRARWSVVLVGRRSRRPRRSAGRPTRVRPRARALRDGPPPPAPPARDDRDTLVRSGAR